MLTSLNVFCLFNYLFFNQDALCREVDTEIDFDDYQFGHYKYLLCDYRGFLCVDYDSKYYDQCPDFEVQFCCPPQKYKYW